MSIELDKNQLKNIADNIYLSNVLYYIKEHSEDYLLWLEHEFENNLISEDDYLNEIRKIRKED